MRESIAVIENGGRYWIGSNYCLSPQKECPRRALGRRGYELCQEICKQSQHAVVAACEAAGDGAKGATLYLLGDICRCNTCKRAIKQFEIGKVAVRRLPGGFTKNLVRIHV